jgi:uridine phosphorylase
MGCPSLDIIVTELALMGVKHFIRIGTAGSLSKGVKVGDIVIANSAVRDESTSKNYAPIEVPAVANIRLVNALEISAKCMDVNYRVGPIHTKDSLFAREFNMGPLSDNNKQYMSTLTKLGILASEMETSHLFILGMTYGLNCATICSIIGDSVTPFSKNSTIVKDTIEKSIKITLESLRGYLDSL